MNTDPMNIDSSLTVSISAPSVAHSLLPLPEPRRAIEIVPATPGDIDWIDGLQKRHCDRVGFHPYGALQAKIGRAEIIIAKDASGAPIGYCMASDRYMKHDDVGIIYQMNVEPGHQRAFVGAALLRAQFERSAYGCRLYCCWCAQDLDGANRFWEAMGFVPLAYRAGSEKKGRVHIFWQKRIRQQDSQTPWWFPAQTQGGSMEDRLVFPIPPGTHWSDAKPIILPAQEDRPPERRQLDRPARPRAKKPTKPMVKAPPKRQPLSGGLFFAPPAPAAEAVVGEPPKTPRDSARPRRTESKPKAKNDPRLIAAARELRDRWLEHVNHSGTGTSLPDTSAKYDVTRRCIAPATPMPGLNALPGPIDLSNEWNQAA